MPMDFSFPLLTGRWCWPLLVCGQPSEQATIKLTLEKIVFRPQKQLATFRLGIICSTRWVSFAIWLSSDFTGSWCGTNNKVYTEAIRSMDGEELCISNLYTVCQELLVLSILSPPTASSRKKTGSLSHIWLYSMEVFCGCTSWPQVSSNSHSLTSQTEMPLRTCSW
jgi:hypothetical protein